MLWESGVDSGGCERYNGGPRRHRPVLCISSVSMTSNGVAPAQRRTIDRVQSKSLVGPDAQVDEKAVVIAPTDPRRTDPFLLLSEDWFSIPGFDWHPHRGLETVTFVLDGVLEHGDNTGHSGLLEPGDVQWMTAGRGIIHRELAYRDEHAHTLQLWVNLPSRLKMIDRGYQDLRAVDRPQVRMSGATVDLISGLFGGVSGPARNHWPITAFLATLEPGARVDLDVPSAHRAFAYVLDGHVAIAGHDVRAGQVVWSEPVVGSDGPSALEVTGTHLEQASRVMVFSGRPIGEHVVMGGPFVMNHRVEITRAFDEYRHGEFGPVPRLARIGADGRVTRSRA
jgi:redox-sensitive bicupin YhaK (pirin superfamily)